MSRSADPGHFFQTSESLATSERKTAKANNTNGDPIKLTSKVLAIHADSDVDGTVYVAEAAGIVRRVNTETNEKSALYTGATAPLTSVAISQGANRTLFAGCWDKTIHSWSLSTRRPLHRYTGHTDFVKCILSTSISGTSVLISGSADSTIIVWDTATFKKLHVLKGHARGILDLALDPASTAPARSQNSDPNEITLFSADSVREIRTWRVSLVSARQMSVEPIRAHETSVNRLYFEPAVVVGEDDVDADLWTASSDKTAKHLVRGRDWEADTVLEHPDFVRDVVVDAEGGWVVTACRDEEVRVWEAASGRLACVYSGHFEEVTALALVGAPGKARSVVSVSIDGTVRKWSLDPAEIRKTREEADARERGEVKEIVEPGKKESLLSAEEEAELAELMSDDD